jgi:hypothetical protein
MDKQESTPEKQEKQRSKIIREEGAAEKNGCKTGIITTFL